MMRTTTKPATKSKRLQLQRNPEVAPTLWVEVEPGQERVGDVFQGEKNPKKWYQNIDIKEVEDWRTYYRPVSAEAMKEIGVAGLTFGEGKPVGEGAGAVAGAEPVTGAAESEIDPLVDQVVIVPINIKISMRDLGRAVLRVIQEGDI